MKQLILSLLTFTLLSCNHHYKKDDLIGIWDVVSATDVETGEVELQKKESVEIKTDSLYLISDLEVQRVFAWRIEGDSIIIGDVGSVYINELTANNLIVEYDFIGKTQLTLIKRK